MQPSHPDITRILPRWVLVVGTIGISFHLFSLGILVLAAPSGPWFTPMGFPDTSPQPKFVEDISGVTSNYYLRHLHMTHNYHFNTNRPEMPQVYFEARIKDKAGNVRETIKYPEVNANLFVRHRYAALAQAIGDDQPVQPPQGELVAAPGKKMPEFTIWFRGKANDKERMLKKFQQHRLPREGDEDFQGPMMFRPSDWSLVLAKSYIRHLKQKYDAADVELVRYSKEPIIPAVMLLDAAPMGMFDTLICNFKEYSRGK